MNQKEELKDSAWLRFTESIAISYQQKKLKVSFKVHKNLIPNVDIC